MFSVAGINQTSAVLVERTLSDKLTWYTKFIRDEQTRNPKLGVIALANRIVKAHKEVRTLRNLPQP